MGLFFSERKTKKTARGVSTVFLEKMECRVCPRKSEKTIEPYGDKNPVIYVLGGSPTQKSAELGKFFSREAQKLLDSAIPRRQQEHVRYNCIVRSPSKETDSLKTAGICCKKSIVQDIENSKPDIIVGLGHAVLPWVLGQHNLDAWSGKFAPIQIGKHTCWFMATYDPHFLLAQRRKTEWGYQHSRFENQFEFDFRRLFTFLKTRSVPVVYEQDYLSGITHFLGENESEVKRIRKILRGFDGAVGLDIETTSLSPYTYKGNQQKLLTIAISTGTETVAFPVNHPRTNSRYRAAVQKMLKRELSQLRTKVAHNLTFELKWLAEHCTEGVLGMQWDDTMLYSYLDDARKGTQSLDFNTVQHLGFSLKQLSSVDTKNCLGADLKDLLVYNGLDAKYTKILYDTVKPKLNKSCQWMHKQRVEMAAAVTKISRRGMPASRSWYKKMIKKFQKSSYSLESKIQDNKAVKYFVKKNKKPFNPQSDKDVLLLFTDQLGCVMKSVEEAALLKTDMRIADLILAHRKEMKILSTYLEGWFVYLDDTDTIHPDYNTLRTATSRLSSNNPNGQNAPKRKNKWCRNGVQAPKGYVLASIDYGQIEARTIGILSRDPAYVNAMWDNCDTHMEWATITATKYPKVIGGMKNLKNKEAMQKWRTTIKNAWTFPLFFGAGINTIARETKIPKEILAPIIDDFWKVFKDSKEWQEEMHSLYKERGYVETAMGFRRYGPLTHSEVLNTPIQGTASTLVNFGINALMSRDFPVIGTIHDSVEFCIKEEDAHLVLTQAAEIMLCAPLEEFDFICAPLVVEIEIGDKWGTMEAWKEFSSVDFGHKRGKKFKRRAV